MKIILMQQSLLETLPPLISLIRILKDLNVDVIYIGLTESETSLRILKELGIMYTIYPWRNITFRERPYTRIWRELTKPIRHLIFRRWVWSKIDDFCHGHNDTVLWAHGMISAAILGTRALEYGKRYVVTLYELGDVAGQEYSGFNINSFYQRATIVECEYNRAHILMAENNLPRLPFVLPNKPYPVIRQRNMVISDPEISNIVTGWGERKVILYQGALQSDRGPLFDIIKWLCEGIPDVIVAVMGYENDIVRKMKMRYANFSFVPFVPPPHHLEVTSHAHVGIAVYKGGSIYGLSPINPIYCAPNKIFEYAGLGIPILCNDIPGLRYSVGIGQAGMCIEEMTQENVVIATKTIFNNYEEFSRNAIRLSDAINSPNIVQQILKYCADE